jgi:hypothetical protein
MTHALRGAGVPAGPGEVGGRHSTSGAPDPALALSTNCELMVVAKTNDVLGIVRSARLEKLNLQTIVLNIVSDKFLAAAIHHSLLG